MIGMTDVYPTTLQRPQVSWSWLSWAIFILGAWQVQGAGGGGYGSTKPLRTVSGNYIKDMRVPPPYAIHFEATVLSFCRTASGNDWVSPYRVGKFPYLVHLDCIG